MQDFKEAEIKQKEQERSQLSFSTFMHSSYTKSREEEFQDIETLEVEPDGVAAGYWGESYKRCRYNSNFVSHEKRYI